MTSKTDKWSDLWTHRPVWTDYIIVITVIGALTAFLYALTNVIPLAGFPISYAIVVMFAAYLLGTGPAILASILSWLAFTYFTVAPLNAISWPTDKDAWANEIAYILGVMFISIAAVHARKSNEQVRELADESMRLNAKLRDQIAERQQAELALRESEERFRATYEQAAVGIEMLDLGEGHLLQGNRVLAGMLGYQEDELETRTFASITHPDDLPHEEELLRQLVAGDIPSYSIEKRYIHKDGHPVWVRVTSSIARTENPYRISIVEDITERKWAEDALRESEENFRTMANAIPQLAWMADPDGYIFWYNKRWYEYTGTTPEQMKGWGWQSVHDPDVLPIVMNKWKASIESGKPFDMEFPLKGADGRFKRFLTRVQPLRDSEGNITRWFGTNTDVTELFEAQETVRKLNEELEQRVKDRTIELENAVKELEAFSYSVSHDLRAPLRAIDGFSNALLKYYLDSLDTRGQDYLQRVRAAAQRMAQLIDDILGLSRAGRAEMHKQRVDMSEMATDIIDELRKSQPERKADVIIKPDLIVNADSHLLRIALDNLLGNAWKFTGNREIARIEFGSLDQNGERVYYIKDNGAGFNPNYADKLFSPFQRLHTESEFPGTGIGLALVQRILRRHGGRIWTESAVDQGATFYFTLGEAPDHGM